MCCASCCVVLFFNDTATTEIYTYFHTLSLHDALPFYSCRPAPHRHCPKPPPPTSPPQRRSPPRHRRPACRRCPACWWCRYRRSEEHTSELQSLMRISYAVFCLKKNKLIYYMTTDQEQHLPCRCTTSEQAANQPS